MGKVRFPILAVLLLAAVPLTLDISGGSGRQVPVTVLRGRHRADWG
jgi:hypothetical protein